MWPTTGGNGTTPPTGDADENARLAATALAAYATGGTPPPPAVAYSSPGNQLAAIFKQHTHGHQQHAHPQQAEVVDPHPPPTASNDELASPVEETAPLVPRGKPEAMAKALGEARIKREQEEASAKKESSHIKKETPSKPKKKKRATPKSSPRKRTPPGPTMDDPVEPITVVEYENLVKLMEQFCKVPFLAEFSRPVALLHPELMSVYSKIVSHPMDMGSVCRSIRRREYTNTRDVRLDMWRIFCNCIRYHTHPSNKDQSMPSFCSIAIHLREYFNSLWQEYMLPSDAACKTKAHGAARRAEFEQREADRTMREKATSATFLSIKTLEKSSDAILAFLKKGGRVDILDVVPVLLEGQAEDDEGDVDIIVENLQRFQKKLLNLAHSLKSSGEEGVGDYTVGEFVTDCRKCFDDPELLQNRPALKIQIKNRIERILGKIVCPIYEANGRGVNQSSIWGCMAATIWARESAKKPYWPALVLGIMAPNDQKEDWHKALTDRNEERLPEKLRVELQVGKKKAQQALKRQSMGTSERQSYFLVEFMGTHEFIWVRENDIVENFDPDDDPNQSIAAGNVTKKKRSSRVSSYDVLKSKTYEAAIDEAKWALEEFEMQLNDTCGDLADEEDVVDEDGEQGYSYSVLCQSDDETEEASKDQKERLIDVDEANELLHTNGRLDFTVAGRKEAKKRAIARKKLKADADKAAQKKEKADHARKRKAAARKKSKGQSPAAKQMQKEQKELERRRKKRSRERERVLKEEQRKKKRCRTDGHEKGIPDKRARAHAIVKGYLTRLLKTDTVMVGNAAAIPNSAVDSSGLLGMALAFRAAAGEIVLDDHDPSFQKSKPYDLIDTKSPIKSSERIQKLEQQLEQLQKEVVLVKEQTAARKELTQKALEEQEEIYENIQQQEQEAKKSDVKKRRKYVKGGKKTAAKKDGDPAEEKTHDDDAPKGGMDLTTTEELPDEPSVRNEMVVEADPKLDETDDTQGEQAHLPKDEQANTSNQAVPAIEKLLSLGKDETDDQFKNAEDDL